MGKSVVRSSFREGKYRYQLEAICCGKPNCRTCPHGPYWYGYFRKGGKSLRVYIGKELKMIGPGREEVMRKVLKAGGEL